jgi:hypothetical protein
MKGEGQSCLSLFVCTGGNKLEHERKELAESALGEARSIVRAMKRGVDMSDVFQMPRITAIALRAFCRENPGDAYIVRNALDFREKVRKHVDRLLAGEEQLDEAVETEDPADETPAESAFTIETERWADEGVDEDDSSEAEA